MTNKHSFFIKETDLSEKKKILIRHEMLRDLHPDVINTLNQFTFDPEIVGKRNCENLIGSIAIPLGIAGPVCVNISVEPSSQNAVQKQLFFPLATTEGALVASVNRGARALSLSDVRVFVTKSGMTRAPVFACSNFAMAKKFAEWLKSDKSKLIDSSIKSSSHLSYLGVEVFIRGKRVFARFRFDTGEAMGMNMVSIALDSWWSDAGASWPEVRMVALSSNVCTDKKDAAINRLLGRGYQVHVETVLSAKVLEGLRVTPTSLVEAHVAKNLVGSAVAGSFSQNMQVANVVAALYIATGQDPAHVVDASSAAVTFEVEGDGVYASIDFSSLAVGTVGGGTALPQQTAARSCICEGQVQSIDVAAAVATAALCAEISGLASLTEQTLAKAHHKHARG